MRGCCCFAVAVESCGALRTPLTFSEGCFFKHLMDCGDLRRPAMTPEQTQDEYLVLCMKRAGILVFAKLVRGFRCTVWNRCARTSDIGAVEVSSFSRPVEIQWSACPPLHSRWSRCGQVEHAPLFRRMRQQDQVETQLFFSTRPSDERDAETVTHVTPSSSGA